jgi:hypothetical protein
LAPGFSDLLTIGWLADLKAAKRLNAGKGLTKTPILSAIRYVLAI